MSCRLSVNLNKIAVLRNSRGGGEPDILRAATTCLDAGADGITVHPRPDARHTRHDDVLALAALTRARGVEFNLEGNPFAPPREGYAGFLALCELARPAQATLVPDTDAQLTSDHGFDFARDADALAPLVAKLKALGCRVSLFADAGCDIAAATATGTDRIELYTGPWAEAHAAGRGGEALPEEGKALELAVLFSRLHRSLDAIVDGDAKAAREWMNHHNPVLDGTPMETVQTITGLVAAINYLDAPKPIF